ncbi:MAG: UDP-glucose dehydrogenase family protein [Thermoplasmatota archaeon]
MKISIIGTGYVGLVTGVGFAHKGHEVICVDMIEEKVKKINEGTPPIYEKNLDYILKTVVNDGRFKATTDISKAIKNTELTFICVGTPSKKDGSIDTSSVEQAARDISYVLAEKKKYHVVCVKSTVTPGTTDSTVLHLLEKSGKKVSEEFGLGMNPEFLREGVAIDDFLKPDRIVIGGYDKKSTDIISRAYDDFDSPIFKTDIRTAEMIKYVSNSLLATKISFANEISRICEKIGVDVYEVMDGVGLDHRINRNFLNAGAGFGGSCFPKDVKALINFASGLDLSTCLLNSVLDVNEKQPIHLVDLLEYEIDELFEKKIALLGLTFKGGTDDVRETRALPIYQELKNRGAEVIIYEPTGYENFSEVIQDELEAVDSVSLALKEADGCIIQNDWDEFKNLSSDDFSKMKNKVIVDGRRVLNEQNLNNDITYIGVGRGRPNPSI